MNQKLTLPTALIVALLLPACGDSTGAGARVETVDPLLARVCRLAADCPGVSATQQDIDGCLLDLKASLGPSDLAELQQFLLRTTEQQARVLTCIGAAICGRFGGGLSSISDSHLMEPYRDCMASA